MLKERHKDTFIAIKNYIKEYGYSPTVRELCDITSIKSTSTMQNHIDILQEHGYITKIETKPRTLHIIKEL